MPTGRSSNGTREESRMLTTFAALMFLAAVAEEPTRRLPADDPRLFQQFMRFHEGVSAAIESRYGQNAQAAAKEQKVFADKLRVKSDEVPKMSIVARSLTADLNKWQADLKSYVERVRAQKQQPDPAVLQRYDQERSQLVNSAIVRLSTTLTPASWAGLRQYVNGEYRERIRIVEVKQAVR